MFTRVCDPETWTQITILAFTVPAMIVTVCTKLNSITLHCVWKRRPCNSHFRRLICFPNSIKTNPAFYAMIGYCVIFQTQGLLIGQWNSSMIYQPIMMQKAGHYDNVLAWRCGKTGGINQCVFVTVAGSLSFSKLKSTWALLWS